MHTIAIGRFNQEIIGAGNNAWIFDNRLIGLSQIAGKDDLRRFTVFRDKDFDDRRPHDVTSVVENRPDIVGKRQFFFVRNNLEMFQRRRCVV